MKLIMKYFASILLLALFLCVLVLHLAEESNAITIVTRPRIRTHKVKVIRKTVPNKRKHDRSRRKSVRKMKDKIRKKDKSRTRVPGMSGKHHICKSGIRSNTCRIV